MYEATRNVLGLMSGTSLDGMDAAIVRFNKDQNQTWELIESYEFSYPNDLKKLVTDCFKNASLKDRVDVAFARWTVECIRKIQSICAVPINLVGTHGQTVFHEPKNKFTFQAGCLETIATQVNIPVVTDFRVQDILLGGQGAPLVPMGDSLLFGDYEAALNLGGFSNVSLGAPILTMGVESAFDICPVNYVLNSFAKELNMPFDKGGKIAASGSINLWALDELNSLTYYDKKPPKSLGAEWVEAHVLNIIDYLLPADALATFCEHIAMQIGAVLENKRTLVTGGGAWNDYLLDRIRHYGVGLVRPDKDIVNFKEAIIFALLAQLRMDKNPNVLGHTTGSGKNHSSGKIFWP
ncbi:MAG: anhydro-N-acetylmuramic acid kinase [Bacteroidota bacterium]|nr:anhydro-N-acetylmuramic acid kinase [Bacteroidota bacterium]